MRSLFLLAIIASLSAACGAGGGPPQRGTGDPTRDSGLSPDTGTSADGSIADAADRDGGGPDGGGLDGGPDGGSADGGNTDGGGTDAGNTDGGIGVDTGAGDTGGGGATGLSGFCSRYFECGGTFYQNPADCEAQSLAFWGECPAKITALDTFSDCMTAVPCEDYDPDAYNPANTVCAGDWAALQQTVCD